ncbi:5972_t:CDS:2, partial [Racocetra fulgida]
IGSLIPDLSTDSLSFAQLYIFDAENEAHNRHNIMPSLDPVTLLELQNMLHDINPYVHVFKQTGDILQKYITAFSDDILNQSDITNKYNLALLRLESILLQNGTRLENFPNMPIPTHYLITILPKI